MDSSEHAEKGNECKQLTSNLDSRQLPFQSKAIEQDPAQHTNPAETKKSVWRGDGVLAELERLSHFHPLTMRDSVGTTEQ